MDFQAMVNDTNQKNSFMLHNGIQLTKMERDHAVVEADLTTWNRNLYGAVHGGMLLTMADCAAGGAARSNGMRYVDVYKRQVIRCLPLLYLSCVCCLSYRKEKRTREIIKMP